MIGSKTLRNYAAGGLGAAQVLRFFWDRIQSTSLRDKTVLVTGGSRGLGLALAREFHARGARVAICARDEKELRRAAEPLGFFTVVCDLKDPAQITRMIRSLEERWGRIDVLVNNAGIISVGPVENMTIEDFQESMEVNFWAMLRTIFASLPAMRRGCRIVNITSFGGAV
ncbi:MAG: SDR family oxidoreductase, partial [Bdellovibrionota bacterium]